MLSLVSQQSFLWQQALFPMTRSLAVAEAAGGLGVFMAAGLAPPTSAGVGLMCPAPSQAVLVGQSRGARVTPVGTVLWEA
jgi:hypothetical protein